jgi:hypothetical protein
MLSGFPYRELVGTDIRLLSIDEGGPDDDLVCCLYQVPLDSNPKYLAVSYVWGDDSARLPIRLNGQTFWVTENLHAALITFRKALSREFY